MFSFHKLFLNTYCACRASQNTKKLEQVNRWGGGRKSSSGWGKLDQERLRGGGELGRTSTVSAGGVEREIFLGEGLVCATGKVMWPCSEPSVLIGASCTMGTQGPVPLASGVGVFPNQFPFTL